MPLCQLRCAAKTVSSVRASMAWLLSRNPLVKCIKQTRNKMHKSFADTRDSSDKITVNDEAYHLLFIATPNASNFERMRHRGAAKRTVMLLAACFTIAPERAPSYGIAIVGSCGKLRASSTSSSSSRVWRKSFALLPKRTVPAVDLTFSLYSCSQVQWQLHVACHRGRPNTTMQSGTHSHLASTVTYNSKAIVRREHNKRHMPRQPLQPYL